MPSTLPLPLPTLPTHTLAALTRLRTYIPPPTTYFQLPISRRAAVLILLFPDKKGELRVLLTVRASSLRSYSGQVALPGGRADLVRKKRTQIAHGGVERGIGKGAAGGTAELGQDYDERIENPWETARREAWEEVGVPLPDWEADTSSMSVYTSPSSYEAHADRSDDSGIRSAESEPISIGNSINYTPPTPNLPQPFILEHLTQLPTNLAKTELGVRPCVAWLYPSAVNAASRAPEQNSGANKEPLPGRGLKSVDEKRDIGPTENAGLISKANIDSSLPAEGEIPDVENTLIPRLQASEVAAVFSAPLHDFLTLNRSSGEPKTDRQWYEGSWISWHEDNWRMHNFYVPAVQKRLQQDSDKSSMTSIPEAAYHRVFGMTARILVDCARVAYAEEPEFEHNSHFGDEVVIEKLIGVGRLAEEVKRKREFVDGEIRELLRGDEAEEVRKKKETQNEKKKKGRL